MKPSEAPGGIYATGTIVRNYQAGDLMDVTSVITANHKGFITFKLCPNNDVTQDPTQDCFDGYCIETYSIISFRHSEDMKTARNYVDYFLISCISSRSHFMVKSTGRPLHIRIC